MNTKDSRLSQYAFAIMRAAVFSLPLIIVLLIGSQPRPTDYIVFVPYVLCLLLLSSVTNEYNYEGISKVKRIAYIIVTMLIYDIVLAAGLITLYYGGADTYVPYVSFILLWLISVRNIITFIRRYASTHQAFGTILIGYLIWPFMGLIACYYLPSLNPIAIFLLIQVFVLEIYTLRQESYVYISRD